MPGRNDIGGRDVQRTAGRRRSHAVCQYGDRRQRRRANGPGHKQGAGAGKRQQHERPG